MLEKTGEKFKATFDWLLVDYLSVAGYRGVRTTTSR